MITLAFLAGLLIGGAFAIVITVSMFWIADHAHRCRWGVPDAGPMRNAETAGEK